MGELPRAVRYIISCDAVSRCVRQSKFGVSAASTGRVCTGNCTGTVLYFTSHTMNCVLHFVPHHELKFIFRLFLLFAPPFWIHANLSGVPHPGRQIKASDVSTTIANLGHAMPLHFNRRIIRISRMTGARVFTPPTVGPVFRLLLDRRKRRSGSTGP